MRKKSQGIPWRGRKSVNYIFDRVEGTSSVYSLRSKTPRTRPFHACLAECMSLGVRGKQLQGDLRRRNQVKDCHASPHQRPGALLVFQGRETKQTRSIEICWIDHPFTKSEIGRKDVAGQSGRKEIEKDGPSGPNWNAGPRLDDRPPEEKTRRKKRRVFNDVQTL